MLAAKLAQRDTRQQRQGQSPKALAQILEDDVNLAVWQRQLPLHISDFAHLLLSLDARYAEALHLELPDEDAEPDLTAIAAGLRDLQGYEGFIADLQWLVSAFACLLGARRIGVRLRVLDKAMCPRFHVDHVPVRLITTYAGVGSEWLTEGAMERELLGNPHGEPQEKARIQQLVSGEVALLKGEKWSGNEGFGLIHRSPQLAPGERRLILTLDWLG